MVLYFSLQEIYRVKVKLSHFNVKYIGMDLREMEATELLEKAIVQNCNSDSEAEIYDNKNPNATKPDTAKSPPAVAVNYCKTNCKMAAGHRERVARCINRCSSVEHIRPISHQQYHFSNNAMQQPPFFQPVIQVPPSVQCGRIKGRGNGLVNQCRHGMSCSQHPRFMGPNQPWHSGMRVPDIGHTTQQYSTNYGLVTATTVAGTTFYRYERPVFEGPFPNGFPIMEQNRPQHSVVCGDGSDIYASVRPLASHILSQDFAPLQSRNSLSSVTPNPSSLSSSSRSSSPFLLSHSDCTRDSGVISTESTDEDIPFLRVERRREIAYEKLLQKIVVAAEETFSDEGLSKDAYLLRQIRRYSQGFVSMKLVASVKAIKKLTRDYNTVVLALRKSCKLEINEAGTKVRRKEQIPEKFLRIIKDPTSLVVIGLSESDAKLEVVLLKYKEFGTIAQVRIVSPNRPLPSYLQNYAAALPGLGQEWCAILEYENSARTLAAYRELSSRNDGVRVELLGPKVKKCLTKKTKDSTPVNTEQKVKVSRHNSGDSTDSGADCDSGIFSNNSAKSAGKKQDQGTSKGQSEFLTGDDADDVDIRKCDGKESIFDVELSKLETKSKSADQTCGDTDVGISVT